MADTIGKIASEAWAKGSGEVNPQEIQRATEQEYLKELEWAVAHARKKVDCSDKKGHQDCKDGVAFEGSFFIEALTKREKSLENVLRNYFIPRQSCPTPVYDQTVYRYNDAAGQVEFLWTIPDKDTCEYLVAHRGQVEEKELLQQVLDFKDGALFKKAKMYNKETMDPGVALEK